MRVTVVLLGHTLDLSLEPTVADEDPPAPDTGAALSGGLLASTALDTGPTDRDMGFTGGWESDDDDDE
jgi:hypothetical protein